jgi:hypothetical protein
MTTTTTSARPARPGGMTKVKAARQIPVPKDSNRNLIAIQHRSLAMLAGESMRLKTGFRLSGSSSDSDPPSRNPSIPEEDLPDLPLLFEESSTENPSTGVSTRTFGEGPRGPHNQKPARKTSRFSSMANFDEDSLEVLCMHVSELMGGAPIPTAKSKLSILREFEGGEMDDSSGPFEVAPNRNPSVFDMGNVNLEMQLEEMKLIEAAQEQGREDLQNGDSLPEDHNEQLMDDEEEALRLALAQSAHEFSKQNNEEEIVEHIEIASGELLPLQGSINTFQALMNGSFSVTECLGCSRELMVCQTADLVVCSDCWLFSPVTKYGPDGEELSEELVGPPTSVGMGVTSEEVKLWFENENLTDEGA